MHKPLTIKRQNANKSPSNNAIISWPTTYKTLYKMREFARKSLPHFATRKIQSHFCKIYSEAKQRLRCCVLNHHYPFERENSYLFADSFTLSSEAKRQTFYFFDAVSFPDKGFSTFLIKSSYCLTATFNVRQHSNVATNPLWDASRYGSLRNPIRGILQSEAGQTHGQCYRQSQWEAVVCRVECCAE